MSTSSKDLPRRAALLMALLVPVIALPGVVGTDKPRAAPGYTLRCWQDGRLILEEQHVSLPPIVDATSTRLQVIDRQQQPVMVVETKNATCLVKAASGERPQGRLP